MLASNLGYQVWAMAIYLFVTSLKSKELIDPNGLP